MGGSWTLGNNIDICSTLSVVLPWSMLLERPSLTVSGQPCVCLTVHCLACRDYLKLTHTLSTTGDISSPLTNSTPPWISPWTGGHRLVLRQLWNASQYVFTGQVSPSSGPLCLAALLHCSLARSKCSLSGRRTSIRRPGHPPP